MSGYSATIALAPGCLITGRSTCTPEGSIAVSTPKSTTPNFSTGRRFEAIVNPECARRTSHASAPIAADARPGDYRSEQYEPPANSHLLRLRLNPLLHRVANRHPARRRTRL